MGVLFENSIVCHVFYAIVSILDGWCCPVVGWFGCLVCLFCFGLLTPASSSVAGWVEPGDVFSLDCLLFGFLRGCPAWGLGHCGLFLTSFFGEFDPGSGRTLAACLTHASRTVKLQLAGVDEWRTGE